MPDAVPSRTFLDDPFSAATLVPNLRHTSRMLSDIGADSVDALFADIPKEVQIEGLRLATSMSEQAVLDRVHELAGKNRGPADGMPVFLGAGLKEHYVPSVVPALVGRSEFYTSYTPYQPEVSQGMLQGLFEYQSMVCALTGMDVANISQYDWATAIGEAALLAARAGKGTRFLVPEHLTPDKRSVLENYTSGAGITIESVPFDRATGTLDIGALETALGPDVVGLYVETPNLFGLWEPEAPRLKQLLTDRDAGLLVVGADPLSLAVADGPGAYGADIVVGELAGYGTPIAYGGPLLGLFAVKEPLVRRMPGRVVGLSRDDRGNHAFTLTLQTREQHIRRERAMSNICTNETLLALAAAVYLGHLGGIGLTRLAEQNEARAHDLRRRLEELPSVRAAFPGGHFDEFTLAFERPYKDIHDGLLERGVHGGYDLSGRFDGLGPAAVFATTEVHGDRDHDRLVAAVSEVVS
ncbi:MAG: aminomethyl-transferring glycine dehydrogenase subunit GcvPA [Euryarchaeota archaeon]|nr:aminomethyl-transferring glycine dehydrogenase subunit GcvPA [Euryarchaeota archaeon]